MTMVLGVKDDENKFDMMVRKIKNSFSIINVMLIKLNI